MSHMSNSDAAWLFAALSPVLIFFLASGYLYPGYRMRQLTAVRKAVIDKFGSAEDFVAFVQSPAGQRFIADLSGVESPARAVIGAIQKALVLVSLGGGLWWAGVALESNADIASVGVLLLCVGVGILISAGISYRLSKSWGLLERPAGENQAGTTAK